MRLTWPFSAVYRDGLGLGSAYRGGSGRRQPLKKFSWRSKALLSTGAAIVVAAMIVGAGPVRRPFALFRANLSGQWLVREDFRGADLRFADLSGANLTGADLSGAENLTQEQLDKACGNADTMLPEGLTLKDMCKQ